MRNDFRKLTVVLNVGLDASLLRSREMVLRREGFIVTSAYSVKEAFIQFGEGDFDVILICHTVSRSDVKKFVDTIHGLGSCIPVISVTPTSDFLADGYAHLQASTEPSSLLRQISDAVEAGRTRFTPKLKRSA